MECMNGKVVKELKAYAAILPAMGEEVKTVEPGWQLIKQGFKTDEEGKPINAFKSYPTVQKKPIDHYEKMKAIYLDSGMNGVLSYCDQVCEIYNQFVPPKKSLILS